MGFPDFSQAQTVILLFTILLTTNMTSDSRGLKILNQLFIHRRFLQVLIEPKIMTDWSYLFVFWSFWVPARVSHISILLLKRQHTTAKSIPCLSHRCVLLLFAWNTQFVFFLLTRWHMRFNLMSDLFWIVALWSSVYAFCGENGEEVFQVETSRSPGFEH